MKTEKAAMLFQNHGTVKQISFRKMIGIIIIVFSFFSCASLNSPNYQSRIKAINKISDQNILFRVAQSDIDSNVKLAAFNKLTDQNYINRLAIESKDPMIRKISIANVKDQNTLFKVAIGDLVSDFRILAFNNISDQNLINRLAVESTDSNLQKLAINKVKDQDILYNITSGGINLEIRLYAFNKISDQVIINNIALVNKEISLRKLAINKITDQNILYKITMDDSNFEAKNLALNRITNQELIYKLATEITDSKLREMAINKVKDQNLIYKIALEDLNYNIKVAAMSRLEPDLLAKLATDFEEQELRIKVVELLSDQVGLIKISQDNDNWDVRKAAFKKLNDTSLELMTLNGKDPALILSAKIRLGQITWNDAFSGKSNSLNNIIGAAAIVDTPRPTSSDVVSACHRFIELGDASRIPELVYLLNTFGDVSLAEDYMNCGQSTLEDAGCSWGKAHGYVCSTGYGSNRVRWGSGR